MIIQIILRPYFSIIFHKNLLKRGNTISSEIRKVWSPEKWNHNLIILKIRLYLSIILCKLQVANIKQFSTISMSTQVIKDHWHKIVEIPTKHYSEHHSSIKWIKSLLAQALIPLTLILIKPLIRKSLTRPRRSNIEISREAITRKHMVDTATWKTNTKNSLVFPTNFHHLRNIKNIEWPKNNIIGKYNFNEKY